MKQRNCEPGDAQTEQLENGSLEYMYRTRCNEVFVCIAKNVDDAIGKRDEWLRKIEAFDELGMVRR